MGKRGPREEPTPLKLVKGTRPDRVNTNAPKFKVEPPAPPAYLSAEEKKVWQQVIDDLSPYEMVSLPDGPSLEAYCSYVSLFRKAKKDVQARGHLVKGYRGSKVKNPSLTVMKDAAEKIRAFAQEFGLTPSARSGLSIPRDPGKDSDPAAQYLS